MTSFYDARANIYAVSTPQALGDRGIALPASAAEAAATRTAWTHAAVQAVCNWAPGARPEGAKAHRCDGLLVGPFPGEQEGFDLLIVNTDGTLAERSGNGLSIFAQAMTDAGKVTTQRRFEMRVHHDNGDACTPESTWVEPAQVNGDSGFWLDLGTPAFGPSAVGALAAHLSDSHLNGRTVSQVLALSQLDPRWNHSIFVRIGNPHCVTLVADPAALPSFEALHVQPLHDALARVAFASGDIGAGEPCSAGVNLQWAWVTAANQIMARVFERGEGPTASSGTSASAVACAAWRAGLINAGLVHVTMPGGTAPVRLVEGDGSLQQVSLFGVARRQ
jgi:diaminopimelate epimerase